MTSGRSGDGSWADRKLSGLRLIHGLSPNQMMMMMTVMMSTEESEKGSETCENSKEYVEGQSNGRERIGLARQSRLPR
jgi:hypothetical protein